MTGGFAQLSLEQRTRLLVGVNAAGTSWHDDELLLLAQLASDELGGAMPSKAETADALARLAANAPGLEKNINAGVGVFTLDGRMVDAPE